MAGQLRILRIPRRCLACTHDARSLIPGPEPPPAAGDDREAPRRGQGRQGGDAQWNVRRPRDLPGAGDLHHNAGDIPWDAVVVRRAHIARLDRVEVARGRRGDWHRIFLFSLVGCCVGSGKELGLGPLLNRRVHTIASVGFRVEGLWRLLRRPGVDRARLRRQVAARHMQSVCELVHGLAPRLRLGRMSRRTAEGAGQVLHRIRVDT
mmetsp:Transcript_16189/g.46049  ORF Transcript_16189/g.46049 Transcript_16189/m.46049 type:complete len:207 (-) Transcript_16189:452-1072(-)